jgi:hypothetical protein
MGPVKKEDSDALLVVSRDDKPAVTIAVTMLTNRRLRVYAICPSGVDYLRESRNSDSVTGPEVWCARRSLSSSTCTRILSNVWALPPVIARIGIRSPLPFRTRYVAYGYWASGSISNRATSSQGTRVDAYVSTICIPSSRTRTPIMRIRTPTRSIPTAATAPTTCALLTATATIAKIKARSTFATKRRLAFRPLMSCVSPRRSDRPVCGMSPWYAQASAMIEHHQSGRSRDGAAPTEWSHVARSGSGQRASTGRSR